MESVIRGFVLSIFAVSLLLSGCGDVEFASNDGPVTGKADTKIPVEEVVGADGEIRPEYEDDVEYHRCDSDLDSEQKVLICHVPPGNPVAKHTICVGEPAVRAHLTRHHGDHKHDQDDDDDYLGECDDDDEYKDDYDS